MSTTFVRVNISFCRRMTDARRLMIERARLARDQSSSKPVSSSSSSSDTSSSSSSDEAEESFKPVFVPKHARVAQIERERIEAEKEEAERVLQIENERYLEQQRARAVAEASREEAEADEDWDQLIPPPIGEEDTEEAYQRWKIRELRRIMKYRGIKIDEEESEPQVDSNVKGAFYRGDIVTKAIDESTLPEREQIASATSRIKANLFKPQNEAATESAPPPQQQSAALTERIRIAQKFTKKSGGMKDL
jgi:hypothetical protein